MYGLCSRAVRRGQRSEFALGLHFQTYIEEKVVFRLGQEQRAMPPAARCAEIVVLFFLSILFFFVDFNLGLEISDVKAS